MRRGAVQSLTPYPYMRCYCSICRKTAVCGGALWIADPRWPQWVYPFASAVDTALPAPPERVHIMLDFAAPRVEAPSGPAEVRFRRYPKESILDWHRRHGLHLGR